jgi:glycosyltransferase involved in cell wall biosynthesis
MAAMARAQTVPFSEIICYDDGSTDDTFQVASDLGLRIIRGDKNRGAAFARNRLLEAASTAWVHFHDADDTMDPELNDRMSALLGPPDTAVMCAYRKRWNNNSQPDLIYRFPQANEITDWVEFSINHFVHIEAFIFPRTFVCSIEGFFEGLRTSEDREFLLRAAIKGMKIVYVDDILFDWEINSDSTLGRTSMQVRWFDDAKALRRCYEILEPRHRKVLGAFALYSGWCLFWDGDLVGAQVRIGVANLCGIYHEPNESPMARLITRLLGTYAWFFLKKKWAALRGPKDRVAKVANP